MNGKKKWKELRKFWATQKEAASAGTGEESPEAERAGNAEQDSGKKDRMMLDRCHSTCVCMFVCVCMFWGGRVSFLCDRRCHGASYASTGCGSELFDLSVQFPNDPLHCFPALWTEGTQAMLINSLGSFYIGKCNSSFFSNLIKYVIRCCSLHIW